MNNIKSTNLYITISRVSSKIKPVRIYFAANHPKAQQA